MLSINQHILRYLLLSLALLLTACGQSNKAKQQVVTNETQAPVIHVFNFDEIKQTPLSAENFGPNPYLENAIAVPEGAVKEYRFAVEALQGGNVDLGEQQLKEMLDKYPELSGPAYNLAVLKKQQGDEKLAQQYLQMAIDRNNANYDARNLQATWLREKGEFDQAEEAYLSIVKSWGGYAPAYKNLGILFDLYLGKPEQAIVYYRQYNKMIDEPESQVNGWIVDIERRYGIAPLSATSKVPAQASPEPDNATDSGMVDDTEQSTEETMDETDVEPQDQEQE